MVGFGICFVVLAGLFAFESDQPRDAIGVAAWLVGVPAVVYFVGTHLSLLP